MKYGYTLVELMIIVVIVSILVGFGVSSYGKARDRQAGIAAVEQVMAILATNQTIANIGKIDCAEKFLGQQLTLVSPNIFRQQSICENDDLGAETTIAVPGIAGLTPATFTFNPLSLGITLPTNPYLLNLLGENGRTYQIELTSSGTIEYKGIE